mmetsp:Transcript_136811/g.324166  ORF Transcript_136811/g.324166 Transcript_136811/m.324166 type:complete len:315 (-) Transcript_136811:1413-2357(-)
MSALHGLVEAMHLHLARQLHRARLPVLVTGRPGVQAGAHLGCEDVACPIDRPVVRLAGGDRSGVALPATAPHARLPFDLEACDVLVRTAFFAAHTGCHVMDLIAARLRNLEAGSLFFWEGAACGMALGHSCRYCGHMGKHLGSAFGEILVWSTLEASTVCARRATTPHARLPADAKATIGGTDRAIDTAKAMNLVGNGHASRGLDIQAAQLLHLGLGKCQNSRMHVRMCFDHAALALSHHGVLVEAGRKDIALTVHLQIICFAKPTLAVAVPAVAPDARLTFYLATENCLVGAAVNAGQALESIGKRIASIVVR